MKLNNDAVRAVMLFIEEKLNESYCNHYITQDDIISEIRNCNLYNKNDIAYAINILLTTDFLDLVEHPKYGVTGELLLVKIRGLTFNGCNFLDDIRKPEIWEVVKKKSKIVGEASIRALSIAGADLSKNLLTDPNALHNFLESVENIKNLLT